MDDAPTPFEALYSAIFLATVASSIFGLGAVLLEAKASLFEQSGGESFGTSGAKAYLSLWFIVEGAVIFQFLRMYYYLHGFDHVREERAAHLAFDGPRKISRFTDRLLRLNMAAIIVSAIKYGSDLEALRHVRVGISSMLQQITSRSEPLILPLAIPEEASLTALRYSMSMVAVFVMLVLWDLNNLCHLSVTQELTAALEAGKSKDKLTKTLKRAARFYYAKDATIFQFRVRDYMLGLKFLERGLGLLFGLASLVAFISPSLELTMFSASVLLIFVFIVAWGQSRQQIPVFAKFVAYVWSPLACLLFYVLKAHVVIPHGKTSRQE